MRGGGWRVELAAADMAAAAREEVMAVAAMAAVAKLDGVEKWRGGDGGPAAATVAVGGRRR